MAKTIKILLGLLAMSYGSYGQQQVMYTQYMFNQLALNPAYAGIHQGISANFLSRHQWVGFEGAPQTQTFSIHSPIKFRPIALGAVLIMDRIGITNQFGAHLSYSYRIDLTDDSKLSFGLQGSFNQYQADYTESAAVNPDLADQNINDFSLNAGAGIMWHSEKFYLGFSVPQLFDNQVGKGMFNSSGSTGNTDPDSKLVRHYFIAGGYVFILNDNLKLKPNILLKWVEGAPLQFDLNTNFLIKEIVWLGISYRSFDSFDALFQIQITPQLQLGYAYDFLTTSKIGRLNNGSHEIMINFVFNRRNGNVTSPRYF